jgi:hypothetical protein
MVTFKPENAEVQQLLSVAEIRSPFPQDPRGGGVVATILVPAAVVAGAGVVARFVVGAGVVAAAGLVVPWAAVAVSCTLCSHCGRFRESNAQEMQHFSPLQKVPFSMATKPVLHFLQLPSPTSSA